MNKILERKRKTARRLHKWIGEVNQASFAGSWLNYFHDSDARKKEKQRMYNRECAKLDKVCKEIFALLKANPEVEPEVTDFRYSYDYRDYVQQRAKANQTPSSTL